MSARSGVVQRRNVASKESVGAVKEKEENLNGDPEEDLDSKETRLTLMEETLLLGLKDREVLKTSFSLQKLTLCTNQEPESGGFRFRPFFGDQSFAPFSLQVGYRKPLR